MKNNNEEYINTLKKVIEFFESHPELPETKTKCFCYFLETKKDLLQAAKFLGSFKKSTTDYYFNLSKTIDKDISLEFSIARSLICEKVVTWKCPDEGLIESYNQLKESEDS